MLRESICLSNNAAERAVRGVAIGRGNWTFAGSDAGGRRAAAVYTLIETCKLNDVDPQAWLAHVLAKLPDHPTKRIDELVPWNWNEPAGICPNGLSRLSAAHAEITCGTDRKLTIDPRRIVLIDETWTKTNMALLRGWCLR